MRLAIGIATAVIFSTATALAAPSAGELLFREGRAAMQEKDYERACLKFAESQRVEPAPGTALNLGECEEQRGHLLAASEAFALAASTFTTPDKQKYATSRAEAVDKRVPRLTVRVGAPPPAGLTLRAGAKTIAADTEVKLDPGDIVIHAEAPGKRPKEMRASLREGKNLDVDIGTLEPERGATASSSSSSPVATTGNTEVETSATPPPPTSYRTLGLIIGGVGAASLIVGGVTGVLALGRASTVKDHCDDDLACDPEGVDAARSGSTLSLVSTITIAAGAAAVVGGAVFFFISPKKAKTATASTPSTARLLPTAWRDGGGVMLRGAF